jgi:hypothetical protein
VDGIEVPRVPLLMTRSSPECHLYMSLHPCACGAAQAPAEHEIVQSGVGLLARYHGPCATCARPREFTFVLDPETPPLDAFGGSRASPLLCPGEFALHADGLASRWPADPAGLSASDSGRAHEDLHWAVRALEEVLKFVPERASVVPQQQFTSEAGKAAHAAEPGRFRKIRLEARLQAWRQLLAAFRPRA